MRFVTHFLFATLLLTGCSGNAPHETRKAQPADAEMPGSVTPVQKKSVPSDKSLPVTDPSPTKPTQQALSEETLLQEIDHLFKMRRKAPPTANEFKIEKAKEVFLASLNSYRGRNVRLRLKIATVSKSFVEVFPLTLDPDFNRKAEENIQRQLRGERPTPIPPSPLILFDFSGIDRGEQHFRDGDQPESMRVLRSIPSGQIPKNILLNLDRGHQCIVDGSITSTTTYSPPHLTWITQQELVIVSVRIDSVSVAGAANLK